MPSINTATVTERRKLRFNSIDDVLADIDRIVTADKAGTLRHTGNWTPGQILGHVAAWIDYGYNGYPLKPPPWIIRVIIGLKKKKYINDRMDAGVKIPGTPNGTFGTDTITTEEGANRLRKAFQRLKNNEPAKHDSPAFGPMPHQDRIGLNLRHAELHMSFLQY